MQWVWQTILIVLLISMTSEYFTYKDDLTCALQYLFAGMLVVFSFGRMRMRIAQPKLNTIMDKTMLTICIFFALRLFKVFLPQEEEFLIRLCWYGFYPCFCMLGYYTVCMAKALDYTSTGYLNDKWLKFVFQINCLIVLIVMTNDCHQLMFTFNEDFSGTTHNYGFGILCLPIKGFIMLQFCIPVFTLVRDAIEFSFIRLKMLLPLLILVYTISYHIGYSLNLFFLRQTETVLVTGFAVMTFWYSALTTGLIATNEKYVELFYASGLQKRIAAARLRQVIFMKLESIVASERPKLLQNLEILKQQKTVQERQVVLQELRLNVSYIKKQCLMFLQGEIYGRVPCLDYQAAINETVRYAREAGIFVSANIELKNDYYNTEGALFSHQLIAKVLIFALEQNIDSIFININCNNERNEFNILMDHEYKELLDGFYISFISHNRLHGIYMLEMLSIDDAVALRLVNEVREP